MKKFTVASLICIFAGFMSVACERDRGVYAGNDAYQPRPAPKKELKGELLRVDVAARTVSVRVERGMEQTFKFDDNTSLTGLENQPPAPAPAVKDVKAAKAISSSPFRNLVGKEGSEVAAKWREDDGVKTATSIEVTEVNISKNTRRPAKRK